MHSIPQYCSCPCFVKPEPYPINQLCLLTCAPKYEQEILIPTLNLKDYGPNPLAINIDAATIQNTSYRTALWTGDHLQVTLMNIAVGDDIGLEVHPDTDQFIRLEAGHGIVKMGETKDKLNFSQEIYDGYAIMIPAGKWHNVINIGNEPLKVYAIYAPPHHDHGTIHPTKADAEAAEHKSH